MAYAGRPWQKPSLGALGNNALLIAAGFGYRSPSRRAPSSCRPCGVDGHPGTAGVLCAGLCHRMRLDGQPAGAPTFRRPSVAGPPTTDC